jgi:hypothetical protein
LVMACLVTSGLQAQLDSVKAHMQRINTVYDSARNMAFDVEYSYNSDTVYSSTQRLEKAGTIMLGGPGRYYYKQSLSEVMQNEKVLVSLMIPERLVIVTRNQNRKGPNNMPFREKFDTLIANNFYGYTTSLVQGTTPDSINCLVITATDSLAIYKKIKLFYRKSNYFIEQLAVTIQYFPDENYSGLTPLPLRKAIREMTMTVQFTNYRLAVFNEDFFSANRFYQLNGSGLPVLNETYANYRLYTDIAEYNKNEDGALGCDGKQLTLTAAQLQTVLNNYESSFGLYDPATKNNFDSFANAQTQMQQMPDIWHNALKRTGLLPPTYLKFNNQRAIKTTGDQTRYDPGTSDFSVEAWVKIDSAYADATNTIVSKMTDYTYKGFHVFVFNKKLYIAIIAENGIQIYTEEPLVTPEMWHHIAVVRKGNNSADWRLYVDGNLAIATGQVGYVFPVGNVTSTEPFRISGRFYYNQLTEFMGGYIKNLRYFKRALDASEVKTIAQNFDCPLPYINGDSLVLDMPMDDGKDTVINNLAGPHGIIVKANSNPPEPDSLRWLQQRKPICLSTAKLIDFGSGYRVNAGHTVAYNFGAANFTMEAWVKTSSAKPIGYTHTILAKEDLVNNTHSRLYVKDNRLYAGLAIVGQPAILINSANAIISPDIWHYVVFEKIGNNASDWKMFIDGQPVLTAGNTTSSFPTAGFNNTNTGNLSFGAREIAGGFADGLVGNVTNVRMHTYAKPLSAIKTEFNVLHLSCGWIGNLMQSNPTMVLGMPLTDGIGTTLVNIGSSGIAGAIVFNGLPALQNPMWMNGAENSCLPKATDVILVECKPN